MFGFALNLYQRCDSSQWIIGETLGRYAYGTAFWSIKAQIGTRRQIQAESKASACIGDKYAFYRTTTHMFNW